MPEPAAPERQRVFVGDVHGCADELEALLSALDYDRDRHELWFVGDLVNRGPASLRVLRRVRELDGGSVLGNHDVHAIARWRGVREAKPLDTLDELLAADDADELLAWLAARPVIVTWDDLVLVHAGLHPTWEDLNALDARIRAEIDWSGEPLRQRELAFAVSVRQCDRQGRQPRLDEDGDAPPYAPWESWYHGDRRVVFGHWAQRGRVCGERVRGLDTGCVWGGELTAWLETEDRFVAVPARERYQEIEN